MSKMKPSTLFLIEAFIGRPIGLPQNAPVVDVPNHTYIASFRAPDVTVVGVQWLVSWQLDCLLADVHRRGLFFVFLVRDRQS